MERLSPEDEDSVDNNADDDACNFVGSALGKRRGSSPKVPSCGLRETLSDHNRGAPAAVAWAGQHCRRHKPPCDCKDNVLGDPCSRNVPQPHPMLGAVVMTQQAVLFAGALLPYVRVSQPCSVI